MKLRRILVVVTVGFLIGTFFGEVFDIITALGRNIPQKDIIRDYGIATMWAVGLALLLAFLPFKSSERPVILWIWFIKCIVTLGVMLVYEHRYGLDAYNYFLHALESSPPPYIPYISSGTRFIEWLSWNFNAFLPVFDSYHALKVLFSFIGLIGVLLIYRAWARYFEKENVVWLYLLGLFPTILFWSSILGKEPVVFFAIGLYTSGTIGMLKEGRLRYFPLVVIGVALATLVRLWLGAILVAPIGLVFLFRPNTGLVRKMVILAVYAFSFIYLSQTLLDRFSVDNAEEFIATSNQISRSWSIGGSAQDVPEIGSFKDMVSFAPSAMFTSLFRPLPGEVNNIFGLIAGLENLIFLGIFVFAVVNRRRTPGKGPVFVWAFALILFWAFVYGMISFQNLGAAVRFKLQIIPALLLVTIALQWDWTKPQDDPTT